MTAEEQAVFDDMRRRLEELEKQVAPLQRIRVADESGGGRIEQSDNETVIIIDGLKKK